MTVDQRAALLHQLQANLADAAQIVGSAQVFASTLAVQCTASNKDMEVQQEMLKIGQAIQRLQAVVNAEVHTNKAEQ